MTPPINDRTIRLIMIPAFGILIPNLTGLFGPLGPGEWAYWLGYFWFILLSFSIWQGNRSFLLKQRQHLDWFSHPARKVMVLLAANVLYTAPLTRRAIQIAAHHDRFRVTLPLVEGSTP